MKHIIIATALMWAGYVDSHAQQGSGELNNILDASAETPRKLTSEEERAVKLALAYAETAEPGLDYRHRLSHFEAIPPGDASKVWTVKVYGTPKKGSKWRCASVQFKVFVHPNGETNEPQPRMRYCW